MVRSWIASRIASETLRTWSGLNSCRLQSSKKKLGRNLRLIASRQPVEEDVLILFLRVLARGSNDYENILRQENPDFVIDRYQDYSDDEIRDIHRTLTEGAPPELRMPPDEQERAWLYDVFRPEILTNELFILETESWVKKMKSTEFLPFLAAYRTLLEQMTDTNRLIVADSTSQWSEIWTVDRDIGIAYHYRPELKRILLLEPLRSGFDAAMLNSISQTIAQRQTLSGVAVRSYPLLMVIDTDAWIAIQKDEESNLALSPEEAKLVEAIHRSGMEATGGFPLFINGRAGSGKSTMLQYLAADYIDFALRGAANLFPLYMTCSEDLLNRARETVQGLVTTHHERLLNTNNGKVDPTCVTNLLQKSFRVFHDYLYSLLPRDRQDSFPRGRYVSYATFRRLWNDQFVRRPIARMLSPEVCWHVIRSYVKGIRSSRSDDLGPLESRFSAAAVGQWIWGYTSEFIRRYGKVGTSACAMNMAIGMIRTWRPRCLLRVSAQSAVMQQYSVMSHRTLRQSSWISFFSFRCSASVLSNLMSCDGCQSFLREIRCRLSIRRGFGGTR